MSNQALGYTLTIEDVPLGAAAVDILTLIPAIANGIGWRLAILNLELGPTEGTVGAGDANEQFGRVAIIRGYTAQGSGGAANTPAICNPDLAGPKFSARQMDTGLASGGTPVTMYAGSFPVRQGFIYRPKKFVIPRVVPGELLVFRLMEPLVVQPIRCSITCDVVEYDSGMAQGV